MKISLPGRGNLYYSAFTASIASFVVGTHYSWTSPTIPKLEAPGSWLPISTEEASWIGSLLPLGTAFGPFLGGWLINSVGRRWTIMSAVAISTIAWVILLFAHSLWQIYVGRFIAGIGGGVAYLSIPTYVAEISEPAVRGPLGSLFALFLVGGFLIEYCCGPYISYSALIILSLIPVIVFVILYTLLPESPYYFLRKDDRDSALENLTWLRAANTPQAVQKELGEMEAELQKSLAEKPKLSDLFATRGNRMALLIAIVLVSGQQFSGVNVVLFYAENIFIMSGTTISSSICTIIVGLCLFGFGLLTAPLVKFFGMKNLLIFSGIGMAIFQVILGGYFYFYSSGTDMSSLGWLPLLCLFFFIATYTVGFGPLPWAVMAEVFPSNIKGLASAITAGYAWFVAFLLTNFFNQISELLGTYISFLFFGVCCFLAALFTMFFVPDTRGMTLQDILDLLNKKPSSQTLENGKKPKEDA